MALCAAVAVKEVAAGHGHQHVHADKREIVWAATETVIETDYYTVTVTEGAEPTVASVTPTSNVAHQHGHHTHSKPDTSVPVATPESSTSTVIAEPSTSTSVVVPTVIPTTMMTAVRPTTTTSTVESTPVSTSTTPTAEVEEPTIGLPTILPTIIPTVIPTIIPTTTSASSTPTPTHAAGSSVKRGLAYNDASLVQAYLTLGGAASWAYNWGSSTADLPEEVTYYPMLWSPAHVDGWDDFAKKAISKGADALLSFNEPDIATQANMSPQDAASGHIQYMNPYAGQARISTPAISSSENAGQGIDWLKQFFSACGGQCKFDFCVAHWYGPGGVDGANSFLAHLKDVNTACDGKPIWVTEFAAEGGDVDAFMSTIVPALESDEYSFVEKYSYFMASIGQLFESTTKLSSFGKIYAGVQ